MARPNDGRAQTEVVRLLEAAAKSAGRTEELIDNALFALKASEAGNVSRRPRTNPLYPEFRPARSVVFQVDPKHVRVFINGRELKLARRLRELLRVLASGFPGVDGIACWKNVEEVMETLKLQKKAVWNLCHRLREVLASRGGFDRRLVQTKRASKGETLVRFATTKFTVIHA